MEILKSYKDFPSIEEIDWTKYIIVVPTEKDRQQLMACFEHMHYSNVDTQLVTVNQLVHEYLDETRCKGSKNNIIVDEDLYNKGQNKNK